MEWHVIEKWINKNSGNYIGCAVGTTVNLQQEGSGLESQPEVFLPGVCMFSPCMHGFSPGTPASSKNMTVGSIGFSKFP